MKVFYCECQGSYAGGVLMVAADTIEEAILIAVKDNKTSCYFSACNYYGYITTTEGVTIEDVKASMTTAFLEDKQRTWIESDEFPLPKWKQEERLAWSGEKGIILINCYYE